MLMANMVDAWVRYILRYFSLHKDIKTPSILSFSLILILNNLRI